MDDERPEEDVAERVLAEEERLADVVARELLDLLTVFLPEETAPELFLLIPPEEATELLLRLIGPDTLVCDL
ncbi:hypothetical protein FACS189430_03620 [Bacteroidia bacterium]|nr:hypothetical protein FACS189430_03620 [Bacteroidia bacterium]